MAKMCKHCGAVMDDSFTNCTNCGALLDVPQVQPQTPQQMQQPMYTQPGPGMGGQPYQQYPNQQMYQDPNAKSKMAGGLLGIFLGALGVHNFYLGYNGKAVAQLLLTLVGWLACGIGPIVAGVWGLIEGIMILTGSINKDAEGRPLKD